MFSTARHLISDRPFPQDFDPTSTVTSNRYIHYKAYFDFSLALILLVALGPLMLFLMLLVKLTSRGSALYTQVRLGQNGQPYTIIKIRTMTQDCERHSGPQWAKIGDPRVTKLGRVLRRCHLDELPQLWNVLRGEMSLVGPRPERPEFVVSLEQAIPNYRDRLLVRPGVTGLAQVQLPADVDLDGVRRKVACDLCYIRQLGPWLDLRILVGTIFKSVGVPFDVTRRLLWLPSAAAEDHDRLRSDSRARACEPIEVIETEPERAPQLQPI